MSKEKFKQGDVVQLRSGSVKMTVESVTGNGGINVVYFSKDNQLRRNQFFDDSLVKDE